MAGTLLQGGRQRGAAGVAGVLHDLRDRHAAPLSTERLISLDCAGGNRGYRGFAFRPEVIPYAQQFCSLIEELVVLVVQSGLNCLQVLLRRLDFACERLDANHCLQLLVLGCRQSPLQRGHVRLQILQFLRVSDRSSEQSRFGLCNLGLLPLGICLRHSAGVFGIEKARLGKRQCLAAGGELGIVVKCLLDLLNPGLVAAYPDINLLQSEEA